MKSFIKVLLPAFITLSITYFLIRPVQNLFEYENDEIGYIITKPKEYLFESYTDCFIQKNKVHDLYFDFVLFNRGERYIDFNRIVGSQFTLETTDSIINIHTFNIKKNRNSLPVSIDTSNKQKIVFNFLENESFDKFDGIKLSIGYSGIYENDWNLNIRVKGVEINKLEPTYVNSNLSKFAIFSSLLLLSSGISILFLYFKTPTKKNIHIGLVMGIFCSVMGGSVLYFLVSGDKAITQRYPQWAKQTEHIVGGKYSVSSCD